MGYSVGFVGNAVGFNVVGVVGEELGNKVGDDVVGVSLGCAVVGSREKGGGLGGCRLGPRLLFLIENAEFAWSSSITPLYALGL